VKGGLSGRSGPADDVNLLAPHCRSLGRRGAIKDSAPDKGIDALDAQASIGDTRGQDDSAAANLRPGRHPRLGPVRIDAEGLLESQDTHIALDA